MDEVERPLRERVAANVVSEHFDIRSSDRGEEIELEIRGGHTPVRADEFGEPTGDRATPAAYLETLGTPPDRKPLDAPYRQWIETLLKQFKTPRLFGGRVRKGVVGRFVHSQILRLCRLAVQR